MIPSARGLDRLLPRLHDGTVNLTIKDLPDRTGRILKRRAAAHERSLNREIISILSEAAAESERRQEMRASRSALDRFRESLPPMSSSIPLIGAERESR